MTAIDEVLEKLQEAGLEYRSVYVPVIQEREVTRTYVMLADGLSLKVTEKLLGTTFEVTIVYKKGQLRVLLWPHPCENRLALGISNSLNRMSIYDQEFDSIEEVLSVLRRMLSVTIFLQTNC